MSYLKTSFPLPYTAPEELFLPQLRDPQVPQGKKGFVQLMNLIIYFLSKSLLPALRKASCLEQSLLVLSQGGAHSSVGRCIHCHEYFGITKKTGEIICTLSESVLTVISLFDCYFGGAAGGGGQGGGSPLHPWSNQKLGPLFSRKTTKK